MSEYIINSESLTATANAVREKTGGTEQIEWKENGFADEMEKVFEAGKKSEYDSFWDSIQFAPGVQSYEYAFAGKGLWHKGNFRPKYDIVPGAGYTVSSMFLDFGNSANHQVEFITDLSQWLSDINIILDTSNVWYFDSMFQKCQCERLPKLNMSNAKGANYIFGWANQLKTIDGLIVNESCTWTTSFINTFLLTNITFEGIIGQDINFQWSPLSVDSLNSIITHLSDTAVNKTVTFNLSAVNTAFETSPGAADGSTSSEWLALTATKPNWTFSLV